MQSPRSLGRQLYSTTALSAAITPTLSTATGDFATAPSVRVFNLGDARGFTLEAVGTTANNQDFDLELYGVLNWGPDRNELPTDWEVFHWGTLTCTLGTNTCAGTTLVAGSYRYADTMVWVPSAYCTAWETAYSLGTTAVFSPADNTIAHMFVPSFPAHGLLLDVALGTAASANAVITRQA